MTRIVLSLLKVLKIILSVGILFSCGIINKHKNEINHIVNDYKNDFYNYRFYKSDTCEALLILIKSSDEGNIVMIQNIPLENFEYYLGKQGNLSKSEVFGIYDKVPIYLIDNVNSRKSLTWVKFDSILNINQADRIMEEKHEYVPIEYEPVLISYYNLDSSIKSLRLQNDSIFSKKFNP